MIHLLLAIQIAQAPDTTLFPRREELLRLYTNCDEGRWPGALVDSTVPKTREELVTGVATRLRLEGGWRRWYEAHGGDSLGATPESTWVYPLEVRGRLIDNYRQRRHPASSSTRLATPVTSSSRVLGTVESTRLEGQWLSSQLV